MPLRLDCPPKCLHAPLAKVGELRRRGGDGLRRGRRRRARERGQVAPVDVALREAEGRAIARSSQGEQPRKDDGVLVQRCEHEGRSALLVHLLDGRALLHCREYHHTGAIISPRCGAGSVM